VELGLSRREVASDVANTCAVDVEEVSSGLVACHYWEYWLKKDYRPIKQFGA
jgi:hypothetical protein